MKKLNINTSTEEYNIFIGEGIVSKLSDYGKNYDKILLLTNNIVDELYSQQIISYLPQEKTHKFVIKDGEIHKTMNTALTVLEYLSEENFTDKTLIICMGGGVICELGGIISSLYMGGIDFLLLPTTLLAQVDVNISGKLSLNLTNAKNTLSIIKHPIAIIVDVYFLKSLPETQFKSGMAEVIKYIILSKNSKYFESLTLAKEEIKNMNSKFLVTMIHKVCHVKKELVSNENLKNFNTSIINIGNTYAYALETLLNFDHITHGEAVAKGIIFELQLSKILGFVDEKFIDKIKNMFSVFEINYCPIFLNPEALIKTMKINKNNSSNGVNFIILKNEKIEATHISDEVIAEANFKFKNRFLKGVIDIGTNTCRLFIAEVQHTSNNSLKIITPLFKDLKVSKLGKNLSNTGLLTEEAITRVMKIIKSFNEKALNMGVTTLTGFATSATREAANGNVLIQAIKTEFDINILIIPGEMEAKLSFNGINRIYKENIATIDVGGGSTEIVIGNCNSIDFVKSFPIGVIKLTEMFFYDDNGKECYTEETFLSANNYLRGFFSELKNYQNYSFKVIGVAGTATTNASMLQGLSEFNEKKINNYVIDIADLKANLYSLASVDLEKRKKIVGLEANRADIIIAGNLILIAMLELLNKEHMTVSTIDNLEGGMMLTL